MEGNARPRFTPSQKAELWDRWKNGQCVADIAQAEANDGRMTCAVLSEQPSFVIPTRTCYSAPGKDK